MKKVIFGLTALAAINFSFSSGILDGEKQVKSSKVVWKGYKVLGSHEGTLNLTSGSLTFDNEILTGGEFVLDVTSSSCTDLEGESKGQLEGHLKSDDFFGVKAYPTAALKMKKVKSSGKNSYTVTADFTMKDVTKEIEFEASIYGNKASASLKIDRTDYNVKYGSESFFGELKDSAIYDEFDIVIDLEF